MDQLQKQKQSFVFMCVDHAARGNRMDRPPTVDLDSGVCDLDSISFVGLSERRHYCIPINELLVFSWRNGQQKQKLIFFPG